MGDVSENRIGGRLRLLLDLPRDRLAGINPVNECNQQIG
jgi:hypothetical protein